MNDKSNQISIIVAIFALILILGGVFLLNASFDDQSSSNLKKATSKSGMTYSVVDDIDSKEDKSSDLFEKSQDEEIILDQKVDQQKAQSEKIQEIADEEAALKKAEQEKQAKEIEVAKKKKEEEEKLNKEKQVAPLNNNQIIVKIDSTDGYNSVASIIGCGIVSITACDSGEPLRLRALQEYTDISIGSQYKLTGNIYEYNGIIRLDTLNTVEFVK
jgi:hypothetical protein